MTVDGKRRVLAATVGLAMAVGVSSAHAVVSAPQVAVEPDGTAHLAWLDGLLTERPWPAGPLGPPQHVSPVRARVHDFDMAADPGGAATFVWRRQRDKVQAEGRRRLADGSMGPLLPLTASATDVETARVATDPAGNSVFAWRRTGSSSSYAQARRLSATGVLGPLLTLSGAGYASREPEVAMDGDGNGLVVWVRHASGGGDVVQARRIAADGALGAIQPVTTSAAAAGSPQVAFDAAGNALVAWLRYDGTGFYPQIRRRSAAGALSAVQTLSAATGKSAAHLRLAVAPGGSAMAVWSRSGQSLPEVQGRHRAADGTLGATVAFSPTADAARYSADVPQVAMDATGNVLVVWHRQDWSGLHEPASVLLRRRGANGTVGSIRDVSTEATGDAAMNPRLGAASDGTATIAWEAWNSTDGFRVHARKRRPDGTYAPIVRVDTP